MPTVPNLEQETEHLSKSSAMDMIQDLPLDKGLYIVSFQKGVGNNYDFVRRTAPIIAEPKPYEHFRGTNGAVEKRPHSAVCWTIKMDSVRDITLCPQKRMPKWGDGSVHYTCKACGRPCIFSELEIESGKHYHEDCI